MTGYQVGDRLRGARGRHLAVVPSTRVVSWVDFQRCWGREVAE